MTDETVTGWRTRLLRAWAFCVAHRDLCVPAAFFVLGVVLGAWW